MDQRLGQLRQQVNRSISQKQKKFKGSKNPTVNKAFKIFQQLKKDVNTFLALPNPEKSQLDELIRNIEDTYHPQIMKLLPFGYSFSKTLNAYVREMEDFLDEMKAFIYANYHMRLTHTQGGQQGKHSIPSDQLGSQSNSSFYSAQSGQLSSPRTPRVDRAQGGQQGKHSTPSDQLGSQSDSSFFSANSGQLSSPRTPRQQPVPLSPHRRTSTRHTTVRKYKNKHIHDAKQLSFTAVGFMTIVAFALSLGFALSKTK